MSQNVHKYSYFVEGKGQSCYGVRNRRADLSRETLWLRVKKRITQNVGQVVYCCEEGGNYGPGVLVVERHYKMVCLGKRSLGNDEWST